MYINYPEKILQSESALLNLEKKQRNQGVADRIKMLRLLKSGSPRSLRSLAPVLGYCERQLQRWWRIYRQASLEGLLEKKRPGGNTEKVTRQAWAGLCREMEKGKIARLKDVQSYLSVHFQIEYQSLEGISGLLKRHQVKLKTGRRRHRRTSAAVQADFKKGVSLSSGRKGHRTCLCL